MNSALTFYGIRVKYQVEDQVRAQVSDQARDQVWQVWEVHDQVWEVHGQVLDQVWNQNL